MIKRSEISDVLEGEFRLRGAHILGRAAVFPKKQTFDMEKIVDEIWKKIVSDEDSVRVKYER